MKVFVSLSISECRPFVLRLWKFLHTVALQRQHTILDSVVGELSPLPQAAITFLNSRDGASERVAEVESLAGKIKVLTLHEVCMAIVWISVFIDSYRESYCGAYKSCSVRFSMATVSFTQALAVEDGRPSSPLPPLPMECVPHILTPQERRLLYDYVVEV